MKPSQTTCKVLQASLRRPDYPIPRTLGFASPPYDGFANLLQPHLIKAYTKNPTFQGPESAKPQNGISKEQFDIRPAFALL